MSKHILVWLCISIELWVMWTVVVFHCAPIFKEKFIGLNVSNQMWLWKRWWNYVLTISMTDRYTVHPVQSGVLLSSGSLQCVHVFHLFYVIWIIDCMCKWQELCTHITHRHTARWAKPDLLTYQHIRMMDTHVGPDSWHSCLADNSWASLCMDLSVPSKTDRGIGAPGVNRGDI